jgi:hypothetical protein
MVRTPSGTSLRPPRPADVDWPTGRYDKVQFRRAHYEIIANVLRNEAKEYYVKDRPKEFNTVCLMAQRLVGVFNIDNPNFSSDRFLKRAGLTEGCDMDDYADFLRQ